MIKLTKLDGSEIYLNPTMIEIIEEIPDTHITLSNGDRYLVLEPVRIIIERIVNFQARISRRVSGMGNKKYLHRLNADNCYPFCRLD